MDIEQINRRLQASTVIAEEWTSTVFKKGEEYYVHFNYEFRIDDDFLDRTIIELNSSFEHYISNVAKVFVITKILKNGHIELFLSNSKNYHVLNLALEDTQSEIIDLMLNEDGDYYQDKRDRLQRGDVAEWTESSCLDVSILDIFEESK